MKMSAQLRMIAKGRFANGDAVAADRLARAAEDYDRLEQENAELREALNVLVYKDSWGNYFTGLHGDSDVTEIVKKLLNK